MLCSTHRPVRRYLQVGIAVSRLEAIARVCVSHSVALAYLFGSMGESAYHFLSGDDAVVDDRVAGDPLADVDLGVVFTEVSVLATAKQRLNLYAALHNDLSDLFPTGRLDLVLLQENHSVFQAQAVAGRCVYAVTPEFRERYEQRILARAADFRFVLDRYHEERLEEVT